MVLQTVALHWSGGKDAALALSRLLADDAVVVDRLVTTTVDAEGLSTVHHLPVGLVRAQADQIGIPIEFVPLAGPGLDGYDDAMTVAASRWRSEGVDAVAFGDLADPGVLAARRVRFEPLGFTVIEPLWDLTPGACIEAFLRSGIRAVTVVVDASVLGTDAVGRAVDRRFVEELLHGCDPCGERGEYHTFVHDGPFFGQPVSFTMGEIRRIERTIATTDGQRCYRYWVTTPCLTPPVPPAK
jgi:uncharacterized protein (TIGR00290 family)